MVSIFLCVLIVAPTVGQTSRPEDLLKMQLATDQKDVNGDGLGQASRPKDLKMQLATDHKALTTPNTVTLNICCLKKTKKAVTVDYLYATGHTYEQIDGCLLTSLIPSDTCVKTVEEDTMAVLTVWPDVSMNGTCFDTACRKDMERFASYHEIVLEMATAEKTKKAEERQVQRQKADKTHRDGNTLLWTAYLDAVKHAQQKALDGLGTTLNTMNHLGGSAVRNLAERMVGNAGRAHAEAMQAQAAAELAAENEGGGVSGDGDAPHGKVTPVVSAAKQKTASGIDIPKQTDVDKAEGFMLNASKQESQELAGHIKTLQKSGVDAEKRRSESEQRNNAKLATAQKKLDDAETEQNRLFDARKAAADRATQKITADGAPGNKKGNNPGCETDACCCSLKYTDKSHNEQNDYVMVPTNFIKWGACFYPEKAPLTFWKKYQCTGFMRDCSGGENTCQVRESCKTKGCEGITRTELIYPPP